MPPYSIAAALRGDSSSHHNSGFKRKRIKCCKTKASEQTRFRSPWEPTANGSGQLRKRPKLDSHSPNTSCERVTTHQTISLKLATACPQFHWKPERKRSALFFTSNTVKKGRWSRKILPHSFPRRNRKNNCTLHRTTTLQPEHRLLRNLNRNISTRLQKNCKAPHHRFKPSKSETASLEDTRVLSIFIFSSLDAWL